MENHTVAGTRDVLVKDIGQLKADAAKVAEDVRTHAGAHVDSAKQKVTDTFVTTREYFTAHPLSLLGAGFVVGLIFGLRIRR